MVESLGTEEITILSMLIVAAVTIIVGLKMNLDPEGFNESIFGKFNTTDEIAIGAASAMRMAIGGGFMAIGVINLFGSMEGGGFYGGFEGMQEILMGTALGLSVLLATVVGAKYRGYTQRMPKQATILLPTLIVICLIGRFNEYLW